MKRLMLLLFSVLLSSCVGGHSGVFRDAPVVTSVSDATNIPEPSERIYYSKFDIAETSIFRPMIRAPNPRRASPAQDINALGEVPNSTWYENRLSVRALTGAEVAAGPSPGGGPLPPFQVVSAKKGGANPGFIMADARGVRFLVKFDTAENPEQQTGNNVIVSRLMWALGYHVPADFVFFFQRTELTLSAKVKAKGITASDIDGMLIAATHRGDGAVRATASLFLSGIPKGGFPPSGTRADDPNDVIPHQHRRSLRGLKVIGSWLGHTDIKENNTLDMYVEEDGRHFLRHYLVDFGEALGGHQSEKDQPQTGFEYFFDWAAQSRALVSFGLWVRPWEYQEETQWKSVGYFGAEHFSPKQWKERYPYEPFYYADAADAFWATKLILRVDRTILESVVAEAQFSAPRAEAYLLEALLVRRDKIALAYLDDVTPLDDFRFRDGRLCATDLMVEYGFTGDSIIELTENGQTQSLPTRGSQVCFAVPSDGAYRIWKLLIRRRGKKTPTMELHIRGGTAPRILGIVR